VSSSRPPSLPPLSPLRVVFFLIFFFMDLVLVVFLLDCVGRILLEPRGAA
jgi:hypothetical protein